MKNKASQNIPENISLERIIGKSGSLSAEKLSNLRDQIQFLDDEYKWFYEDICNSNSNKVNDPLSSAKRRK